MGCIYKITNSVNGKAYIGKSISDGKHRISNHFSGYGNIPLKNAVAKYGKDVFNVEILHEGIIPELLSSYEIEAIAKHDTVRPKGFNLTHGGEGLIPSEETRRKISEANKNPSEKRRREISETHKGKRLSEETRSKIGKASKGRVVSDETRRKISESKKRYWAEKRRSQPGG